MTIGTPTIDHEKECARLQTVIANALLALEERRYGDLGRLLRTGECKPVLSGSSVLAFPGGK